MKKLNALFFIPILLLSFITVQAQTRTVKGKVVSENNQPLVGAAVQVKGKTTGTTTGNDGTFTLSVPSGSVTLVISSVGFASIEKTVDANSSDITITLTESSSDLNAVVVTALGIQRQSKSL